MSSNRLGILVIFILALAVSMQTPTDGDTFWHLASAGALLEHGFSTADPFSYTADLPWVNHNWGGQLPLYFGWRVGGDIGLVLFTGLCAALGLAAVYQASTASASPLVRIGVVTLAALAAAINWAARPLMISFALAGVLIYLLHLIKTGRERLIWIIPVLLWAWGNLHGGYPTGFLILAAFIAGETLERWTAPKTAALSWPSLGKVALALCIAVPVLAINPYGLDIYRVPFDTINVGQAWNLILEWQPPNFRRTVTLPFLLLILLLLAAIWGSRKRMGWTAFFLTGGTLAMALVARRNIALFALVTVPVTAAAIESILAEYPRALKRLKAREGWLLMGVGAACLIALTARTAHVVDSAAAQAAKRAAFPVEAVNYIRDQQLPGHLMNSYEWGGYLIHELPDYPVFVDSRADLYGAEFLDQYLLVISGYPIWRDVFQQYDIRLALLPNTSGLTAALRADPTWRIVYTDPLATIFALSG
jgi:hypothetical protein